MTPAAEPLGQSLASDSPGARGSWKWTRPRDGDLWTQGGTPRNPLFRVLRVDNRMRNLQEVWGSRARYPHSI